MKKFISKIHFYFFAYLLFPVLNVYASQGSNANFSFGSQQSGCSAPVNNLSDVFTLAFCILRSFWPVLITLAVIVFTMGVIKYVANADDSTKREEGRNFMIYGIIGLFVMVSVWALVGILSNTFGFGNTTLFIPQLQE
jgi:hypothetical protein